jgi:hypothetical protein
MVVIGVGYTSCVPLILVVGSFECRDCEGTFCVSRLATGRPVSEPSGTGEACFPFSLPPVDPFLKCRIRSSSRFRLPALMRNAASARISLSGGGGYNSPIPTRGTFGRIGSSKTVACGMIGVVAAEVVAAGVEGRDEDCARRASSRTALCCDRVGGADFTSDGGLPLAERGLTGADFSGGGGTTIGSEEGGCGVSDGAGELCFLRFNGGSFVFGASGAFDIDRRVTGVDDVAGGTGVSDIVGFEATRSFG